jgi:hypothetical protein
MRSSQSPSRTRSAAVSAVRSGSAARKVTAAAAGPVMAAVFTSVRMVVQTDSHAMSASVSSRSSAAWSIRVKTTPVYPGLQDPGTGRGDDPALGRAQRPMQEPEQLGVRPPEADMELPAGVQALDWIGIRVEVLAPHVTSEPVLDHRVEQPVLVAEEPVDRGRLHPGRERDRAGGHRVRALGGKQARRDFHQLRARSVARRHGIQPIHVIDDNRSLRTLGFL